MARQTLKTRNTFRFMLILAMFGSGLFFLFSVLIYSLRQQISTLQATPLPSVFWASTVVIALSSISLHWAYVAFRQDKFKFYRTLMFLTFVLGTSFCVMQVLGWQQMYATPNLDKTSVGFVYLISGMHLLHIVVGIFFLAKMFAEALRNWSYVSSFVYAVNPPNQQKLNLIILYWHFVDVLWVVLFLVLLFQNK
jgi:cytochrome c oxidase subunit III